MKRIMLLALAACTWVPALAQNPYDVAAIKPELKLNANVVVRNEELVFDVSGMGSATKLYKTAITVLNKNGDEYASMSDYYDKFSSISNLKATLYDSKGNKVREYKPSDFKDRSMISDFSLYEDNRVKYLPVYETSYPYTIEYSYSKSYNGILSYPSWMPVGGFGISVEKSSYTIITPADVKFKYRKSPLVATDSAAVKDKMQYVWRSAPLAAFAYEPMSTGLSSVTPWVNAAPYQFEYDHTKGDLTDWTRMGLWIRDLSANSDLLPEATKAAVQALVKDEKDEKLKVKKLYEYLQNHTRYVSVQLGIGGFKPTPAERTAQVSYGDCKALSNYMRALLKEAGISSQLIVLGSGMPSLNRDFASFGQANHMILAVPMQRDTVWLECTSQRMPFGYIGGDNSDRLVMAVTADGGKLVRTPAYTSKDNNLERHAEVVLDEQGNGLIRLSTRYGFRQFEDQLGLMYLEPSEQKKYLNSVLGLPGSEIAQVNYSRHKDLPELTETIGLSSRNVLSFGAGRAFLAVNLLNRRESVPPKLDARKTGFSINYSYTDKDVITYTLPKGYAIEFLPREQVIKSEFGEYSFSVVAKDDKIIYTRTQTMQQRAYPASKYNELVDFYNSIYKADKQKVVLAKKEG